MSWFGKGLRGPLRDAIVIQAVSAQTRGRAFGFHRAADTIGAVIGPLLGVAVLGWAQALHWDDTAGPFRFVLGLSVVPGALAVLAFLVLVKDPEHSPNPGLRLWSTRLLEEGYGPASLQLEIIKTHIGTSLLENAAVVRWLAKRHPEYLQQLQRIADIKELASQ
ncbi:MULTISPECIES: MFS transporter [Cupriavidus]